MGDKYKVERLSYIYERLDVGPGPRECGNVLRMGSMLRNYRKTFLNLELAVKEFEKLRKRLSNDVVIIISKFINKEYVPGKVIISSRGIPSWQLVDNFYTYGWKRLDTKYPLFRITMDGKVPDSISQRWFFEKKPTFSELMKTGALAKAFTDKQVTRFMKLPLLSSLKRY